VLHLQNVMNWMLAHPEDSLVHAELFSPGEKDQLIEGWNQTEVPYPEGKTFNELFAEQVARTPNKLAAVCGSQRETYQELHENTNRLGHAIRSAYKALAGETFKAETVIGVYGSRGIAFFSSMLGIFKAGGVHLPLDPTYPAKRIAQVLMQSGVRYVTVTKTHEAEFRAIVATLEDPSVIQIWVIEDLFVQCHDTREVKSIITPDNLAYLMYTSGSTGLPKGAMVEHKGMVNHLYAKLHDVGATADDVFVQNASQCFDVSVFQFVAMLVLGATIVVVSEEVASDPIQLMDCIDKEGVTLLEVVPSMIRILIDTVTIKEEFKSKLSGLRWLISTGDALLPDLCDLWFAIYPNTPILNTYGPTECSDDVMHYAVHQPVENKDSIIPIGYPIQNMKMYVLDKMMQPVPVGVMGELYIGGLGVGRGYLNDPERTKEAFMTNLFVTGKDNRLYKTGDLVKRLEEGSIEFIGRLNSQVKIRGFRVGLGEIESVLRQYPGIKECAVIVGDSGHEKHLVAYCVLSDNSVTTEMLRQHMKGQLPDYMVPSYFVALEALPLNSNGKIDRKHLPSPDITQFNLVDQYVAPITKTEKKLAEILKGLLKLNKVSTYAHFFDIGGDSLSAVRYKFKIDKELSMDMSLSSVFECPTIESLAKRIDASVIDAEVDLNLYEVVEF